MSKIADHSELSRFYERGRALIDQHPELAREIASGGGGEYGRQIRDELKRMGLYDEALAYIRGHTAARPPANVLSAEGDLA